MLQIQMQSPLISLYRSQMIKHKGETYLIRLHLQTWRGLIENMIPPVEGELLPFLMTNLLENGITHSTIVNVMDAATVAVIYYQQKWCIENNKQMTLTPPLSHLTLTLIASDMPFAARPRPLPKSTVRRSLN